MSNEELSNLIAKYEKLIYKICFDLLREKEEAENAFQETFLSLYRNYERYGNLHDNELKNVLCKIAANKCLDILRKPKLVVTSDEEASNIKDDFDIFSILARQELSDMVKKKVDELKEPYKEIIIDYYFNDISLEKLSKIRGSTIGTLKMQIHRAKLILRENLEDLRKEMN